MHTPAFSSFPGLVLNLKGVYDNIFAINGGIGLLGEYPIVGGLAVALRAGYADLTTQFSQNTQQLVTNEANLGAITFAPTQYRLITRLGAISIAPMLTYHTGNRFTLYGGANVDMYMIKQADVSEVSLSSDYQFALVQPQQSGGTSGGTTTFTDSRTIATNFSVPTSSFAVGITAGLSYEIPLDQYGYTLLSPEIFGTFGVTPVASGLTLGTGSSASSGGAWRMNSVRAGISLRFSPFRTEPISQEELRQEARRQDSILAAERRKNWLDRKRIEELRKELVSVQFGDITATMPDGTVLKNPDIVVNEVRKKITFQMLNMVFFEENSAEISYRYRLLSPGEIAGFQMEQFAQAKHLQVYYNLLNILGRRMAENSATTISLVGYSNGGRERINTGLGLRRANAVKAYLVRVWHIPEWRIITRGEQSSVSTGGTDTQEEQRVEIVANSADILRLVEFTSVERIVTPSTIEIAFDVFAGMGWKQWFFEASQFEGNEDRIVRSDGGRVPPPVYRWNLMQHKDSIPAVSDINLRLEADDILNRQGKALTRTLTVKAGKQGEQQPPQAQNFMLFAFDYRTGALNDRDPATMEVMNKITAAIQAASKQQSSQGNVRVMITGYTDSRGSQESNQALSLQRAQNVARALGLEKAAIIRGGGVASLYDNNIPEGRFYNRHVVVSIEQAK